MYSTINYFYVYIYQTADSKQQIYEKEIKLLNTNKEEVTYKTQTLS